MEECECLWGSRKSENGFKVTSYKEGSLVVRVEKLWSLIYHKFEITNGSKKKSLANGVLVKRKGVEVN
jgi:hypothetical protein